MIGEYTCEFLKPSGEVCGRTCMRPEGCCYHKNSKTRIACSECGKGIRSMSGRCPNHTRGFYVVRHYQKHYKKKHIEI
jgi:hypothetical protein